MALCERCTKGQHSHNNYGPRAVEVTRGDVKVGDTAECPYLVSADNACTCSWRGPAPARLHVRHCPTCRCDGGA